MPFVQIDMIEGRTLEQKRLLAQKVTDAISESVNCPKESVSIIIREMPKEHTAKAGILKCDQ